MVLVLVEPSLIVIPRSLNRRTHWDRDSRGGGFHHFDSKGNAIPLSPMSSTNTNVHNESSDDSTDGSTAVGGSRKSSGGRSPRMAQVCGVRSRSYNIFTLQHSPLSFPQSPRANHDLFLPRWTTDETSVIDVS